MNFTIDEIRAAMDVQTNIRNISVIAHVDHGKTTLTDSLIAKAGIIKKTKAGEATFMDTRQDEQDRGITIKSTGVSLYYEYKRDRSDENCKKEGYLINLIDSPGHVDFSAEVTSALRVTDGALVVVCCVEGCSVQTETVLSQALTELIRPVLFCNKLDRFIGELKYDSETIYTCLSQVIDNVNVVIDQYEQPDMGELLCSPEKGNVAFGSGFNQWGFTIGLFADRYKKAMGLSKEEMMDILWGDCFYNKKKKKTTNKSHNKKGKPNKRLFCKYIMDPILKMHKVCGQKTDDNKQDLEKMLTSVNVELSQKEWKQEGRKICKTVMQKWLNASEAILEMVVLYIPSPKMAQKYRVKYLYEGPQTDQTATSIGNCDPNGVLCMFVSKMFPTKDYSRFRAFGRVFSGTIKTGQKIRIQGGQYEVGKKHDCYTKTVQRTILMMGGKEEPIEDVPCGNTVALIGVDDVIKKQATIISHGVEDAHNIRMMKYTVSPVVRVSVRTKRPQELPKLIAGLRKLSKSDPLVIVSQDENTKEHIIAGCGDLHVEICLKDLRELYTKNCEIIQGEPVVSYAETVTQLSDRVCLSKSPNKQNRLWCQATTLKEDVGKFIEDGNLKTLDQKSKNKWFVSQGWLKHEAQKIWDYGPLGCGPNVIVDTTKGVQYLNDIKDSWTSGFQDCSREGVLCAEECRNVRFNVMDAKLHNDSIHRGGGQIIPTARRVMYAAQITAETRLLEPIFLAEITCPIQQMSGVYKCLNTRRGEIQEEVQKEGSPLNLVKAYLPVAESFGFTNYLRQLTAGKAFPTVVFDHWQEFGGDPFDEESKCSKLILDIRKRKGLKIELPVLEKFNDKL